MAANTKPLSHAEDEVRKILDEAISASVTASNPGITWGKLMTITQMQRPPVDNYISQRSNAQSIHEVNIGDSINPFRGEIVKLIYAMQLTGCFRNTVAAPLAVTRTNGEVNSFEISSYDSCTQAEHKIRINQKFRNTKWSEKHFRNINRMSNVSDDIQPFNRHKDADGRQNCAPFAFNFNAHKEEITKDYTSEQPNEPNIDSAAYKDDYDSYLVARYENEYGDVNFLSTNNDEFCKLHDKEEEGHTTKYYTYVVNKSTTEQQCVHSTDKQEDQATSCSTYIHTNQNLQKCKSKDSGVHHNEQMPGHDVEKVSELYQPETFEKGMENALSPSSLHTYSVTCASSSSENLAQTSYKKTPEYTRNKKLENQAADEQKELQYLSEVTDSKNVCGLCGAEDQKHYSNLTNTAAKDNSHNNKLFTTDDQLHLSPKSDSVSQFSNERNSTDDGAQATANDFKQCSPGSVHTKKYLFQNFIQPEDEQTIQFLLEDNLSSSHKSSHHKRFHDERDAVEDYTFENTMVKQGLSQCQENSFNGSRITRSNVLENSSQITKNPRNNLNDPKETVSAIQKKSVLQDSHLTNNYTAATEQINQTQQYLNYTNSSTESTVSNHIRMPYINRDVDECQKKNLSEKFSDKKVYWSSVGLIIEELIDSNVLPVAGYSDTTMTEPQDIQPEKQSSSLYDDGTIREQMTDFGTISFCDGNTPNGFEETSFVMEPDIMCYTNQLSKNRAISEKLSTEDPSDKSKNTKQSKPKKRSFFESLRRVFHRPRKQ